MNGDVAKLVMDKETTKALGGIVVIDHYVKTPERLAADIKNIARSSGGKVILGEFGAPIPDIHGEMNETEQADWLDKSLSQLIRLDELVGINYWTSVGGSTQIWNDSRYARKAVSVLTKYFTPRTFSGVIIDESGKKIAGALFSSNKRDTYSDSKGQFSMPFIGTEEEINISADGFSSQLYHAQDSPKTRVVLIKTKENLFFKIKKLFYKVISKLYQ
jgi:hypothetical protein